MNKKIQIVTPKNGTYEYVSIKITTFEELALLPFIIARTSYDKKTTIGWFFIGDIHYRNGIACISPEEFEQFYKIVDKPSGRKTKNYLAQPHKKLSN